MQLHIEWLKEQLQGLYDDNRVGSYTDVFREKIFLSSIKHAESLLEKEKEQLERAWQDGAETAQNDAAKEIRNNYTPNKL